MRTTKRVGVGREFFSEIIDGNFYYVDKTRFLRPVLTSGAKSCSSPVPAALAKP